MSTLILVFHPHLKDGSRVNARLLAELAAAGCEVRHLSLGRQNLEQVFMRLTRRSLRD